MKNITSAIILCALLIAGVALSPSSALAQPVEEWTVRLKLDPSKYANIDLDCAIATYAYNQAIHDCNENPSEACLADKLQKLKDACDHCDGVIISGSLTWICGDEPDALLIDSGTDQDTLVHTKDRGILDKIMDIFRKKDRELESAVPELKMEGVHEFSGPRPKPRPKPKSPECLQAKQAFDQEKENCPPLPNGYYTTQCAELLEDTCEHYYLICYHRFRSCAYPTETPR